MKRPVTCPICGYEPGRDPFVYPSLARLRSGSAVFERADCVLVPRAEWEALKDELARLREDAPARRAASCPSSWRMERLSGSIRPADLLALPEETEVPAVWEGCPVRGIANGAFSGSAVRRVVLPEGIEEIGAGAFADCGQLTEVVLPDSLRAIGSSAFENCASLHRIALPESLWRIGSRAFAGAPVKTVELARSWKSGRWSFLLDAGLGQCRFVYR